MCEEVRFALSARIDGEEPGQPPEAIEAHLAGCPSCVTWQQDAQRVTRAVRVQPARVPDLTDSIMATVAARADGQRPPVAAEVPDREARATARTRELSAEARRQVLRVAVAAAAVVQLALALPVLLDPTGAPAGIHAGREMASFDMAVAVGFLLAAYRPARARAYVPVALVLALCLAVTSGIDLARGATVFSHEIGHLVAVVQAALLYGLGRANHAAGQHRVREVPT
ncbi:MAG: hypothetical protein V7603_2192 [Micromonosporaceae bacterium]